MLTSEFFAAEKLQKEKMVQQLLHYGYSYSPETYSTKRPDQWTLSLVNRAGEKVIGKLYSSDRGPTTFRNMQNVWNSAFGQKRTPPGLPRPIEYLEDVGIVVMECLPGRPLIEFASITPDILNDSICLLADLHSSDAEPIQTRDERKILKSLKRKQAGVQKSAPEFSRIFGEIVERLQDLAHQDAPLVPSHGDFSPRNLLIGNGRMALIDWDRFQKANPERDVAYIGVWYWTWLLRQRKNADWNVRNHAVSLYEKLRPEALSRDRLPFHIVAGLLRIAHSLVEFWPEDRHFVLPILLEARKQLL